MKKQFFIVFITLVISLQIFGKGTVSKNMYAKIVTDKGEINLKLFPEKSPVTVANFVNLVKRKYYDGIIFHRVIDEFMAQGGDPTGTGMGGPGYRFEDETNNGLDFFNHGKLAMANAGPNTNGSQFFITTVPTEWLNGNHTIFGEVVSLEDLEVVKSLVNGVLMKEVTVYGDGIEELLEKNKDRVDFWNEILDSKEF